MKPSGRRTAVASVAVLLLIVWIAPVTASAQVAWDPAAVVDAYSTALNAHDLAGALALFDQYGSASDTRFHHFSGADGLSQFLLDNGFASPDAHITTEELTVVANRAIWVYSCTCAVGPIRVHLTTTTDGKISVFGLVPSPTPPAPTRNANDLAPWLMGAALLLAVGLSGWAFGRRRTEPVVEPPRPTQGHLLLALRQMHAQKG